MLVSYVEFVEVYDFVIMCMLCVLCQVLWCVWIDFDLLKEWWCLKLWIIEVCVFDLLLGGVFYMFMCGFDGGMSDNFGCFFEIVLELCIVFMLMFMGGWWLQVLWMGFMVIIMMVDDDVGSCYEVCVMYFDVVMCECYEVFGFFEGWNICIMQFDVFVVILC